MRRRLDPSRCAHRGHTVPATCPCKPGCYCHHGRTCDRRRGARRGKQGGNAGRGSRWVGKAIRQRIYERDGHQCVWCGSPGDTLDHVIPRALGGTHRPANLVTACGSCNAKRGKASAFEWIQRLWPDEGAQYRVAWWVLSRICEPVEHRAHRAISPPSVSPARSSEP